MRLIIPLLALVVLLLTGCARTATETAVSENGDWTRTVKLYLPKEGQMGGKPPTFEESFVLPMAPTWKVSRTVEKDNQVFTATRTCKLGESISRDIQVKEKEKVVCVNEVTVSQIAPGKFEYKETIKYLGGKKPEMDKPVAELVSLFKPMLPEGTDDATIKRIVGKFFVETWHVIFGPSDPMLSALLFSPDLAERRMKAKFGRAMDKILAQELGDKLDKEGRLKVIRALVAKLDSDKVLGGEKEKQKEESSGNDNLVAMFSSVKLPGKIVETDGEIDEVSGEVFWAFYPESAQVGDVVLRAVCEVPGR